MFDNEAWEQLIDEVATIIENTPQNVLNQWEREAYYAANKGDE